MTQEDDLAGPVASPLSSPQVRMLKIAIAVMSLMIVAGLAAVIGRIIYLGSGGGRQATAVQAAARGPAEARLALPPQATVRQLSISGDRLAVHYESPSGAGIAVLDTATGVVLTRISLVPEVPR